MAKIVFKFLEANIRDDEVFSFIEKVDEVLKKFAGEAYHFRYSLEEPLSTTTTPETKRNGLKRHNGSRYSPNGV